MKNKNSSNGEALAKPTGAKIVAHENVLKVMKAPKDGTADDRFRTEQGGWPTETYSEKKDAANITYSSTKRIGSISGPSGAFQSC